MTFTNALATLVGYAGLCLVGCGDMRETPSVLVAACRRETSSRRMRIRR